ncbi:mechanosensitive ion channel [Edaphobacillus lindanitolerans]|uniref:Conserved TM helix n=1 Tax=Edaphobacillus lindanitolerans TaxID=550447 RepID=A0A1U7PP08_9BACI|nr:mechanosensitive ion channel [Edaphobacillus lindanitolerans]SIT75043.1 Conserved TM helix [Edaphobacillus lindanitolerans]
MIDEWNYNRYLDWIPELLLGLVVLIVGYIIAKILESVVDKGLRKGRLDERVNMTKDKTKWTPTRIISKVVFWGILLLAFMIFFNMVNMGPVAQPFAEIFAGFSGLVKGVIKAGLILLVAWIIATLAKKGIQMLGGKVNFNRMLSRTGQEPADVNKAKWVDTAANVVFYLILLLFIPAMLDALNLHGISGPFEGMLQAFLAFIPNLVGAVLIFAVGYLVAKIVRDILTKFLEAAGLNRLAQRMHISDYVKGTSLAKAIGTIVFILIMIPVTISALETLNIRGISEPAIAMLNDILAMIPNIAVAVLLILAGVFLAKWLKGVVVSLLDNLGLNSLAGKMGMKDSGSSSLSISNIIGTIVQIIVILMFVAEALQIVNLAFMTGLATAIFAYLPMVIAAVVILAVGFWLANLAERFVGSILKNASGEPHVLRFVAKYAILAFAFFMAISQLGIAPMIINTAFLLILGGLALAFGLAFGLGGREHASRYLSKMETDLQQTEVSKTDWKQEKQQMKQESESAKQQAKQGMEQSKYEARRTREDIGQEAKRSAERGRDNATGMAGGNPADTGITGGTETGRYDSGIGDANFTRPLDQGEGEDNHDR